MKRRVAVALLAGAAAIAAAALLAAPAGAAGAARSASCASKGSTTLRSTSQVRVSVRRGEEGRVFVACHKATDRRRALAREAPGARFVSFRVRVSGTLVIFRWRTEPDAVCKRRLDVATDESAVQCVG